MPELETRRPPNTLVCLEGAPFNPNELANFWDHNVAHGDGEKAGGHIGMWEVTHWRREDVQAQIRQSFDAELQDDLIYVDVFHDDVDPRTMICQRCGKTCYTPPR